MSEITIRIMSAGKALALRVNSREKMKKSLFGVLRTLSFDCLHFFPAAHHYTNRIVLDDTFLRKEFFKCSYL